MAQFWDEAGRGAGKDVPVISLAGGHRDELIEPASTDVGDDVPGMSMPDLTRFLGRPADGFVPGVDHRALAWCQNVLRVVHDVLRVLAEGGTGSDGTAGTEALDRIADVVFGRSGFYEIADARPPPPSFDTSHAALEAATLKSLGPLRRALLRISSLSFFVEIFSLYFVLASYVRELLFFSAAPHRHSLAPAPSSWRQLDVCALVAATAAVASSLAGWRPALPTACVALAATAANFLLSDALL
eukprot:CAMPEP_0194327994 /NCGR_PEP_ID=MMETSP0171-20130528/43256_1 /TAXON_ID=218684 /ORGANISM="Corethron pennatum, Strain L29A3" /LENGTH=242 /DNA_ID=CAMNT_0039088159 /DNA_START=52 /DNA_END=776 /DNA_ORIENTATION=-